MGRIRPVISMLVVAVVALAALNVVQWRRGPRELSRQELIDAFTVLWAQTPHGIFQNRWLAVPTLQNPMDVWITQEIISEVKPDVIVEAGTFLGGSAALWATILEQVNPEGRVITMDIENRAAPAKQLPVVQRRVDFLLGSSIDPTMVSEVRRRVEGKRIMVILDSAHTKEHVLGELRAYAPLVPIGSYIVVQDSAAGHPVPVAGLDEGPWEAVAAFLAETDDWEIDHDRERLLLTNNRNGYLRRVR
jgi:cephalosporin hydroxylase